jgi:dolichyl-phosphate-mannose--protein O-mannosyl transferase
LTVCLLFFIIIPLIIYGLSYIPFMMVPGPGHGIGAVVDYQVHMYKYHSGVKATHPFSSTWWEWPVIKTPAWYYDGSDALPPGKMSTISALGNPAIWWAGIIAVLAAVFLAMKHRNPHLFVILTAFAAQYLTWAIAPRDCTFIYHFFGAVPFVILCITYVISYIEDKNQKNRYFVNGYLAFVLILFIMFYPVLSGMVVSKAYAAAFLRWFESWVFFT